MVWVWYTALALLLLFLTPGRAIRGWIRAKDLGKKLKSNPMEPAKTIPVILGTLVMVDGGSALLEGWIRW